MNVAGILGYFSLCVVNVVFLLPLSGFITTNADGGYLWLSSFLPSSTLIYFIFLIVKAVFFLLFKCNNFFHGNLFNPLLDTGCFPEGEKNEVMERTSKRKWQMISLILSWSGQPYHPYHMIIMTNMMGNNISTSLLTIRNTLTAN